MHVILMMCISANIELIFITNNFFVVLKITIIGGYLPIVMIRLI